MYGTADFDDGSYLMKRMFAPGSALGAAGHSASELVRKGLRVVASRYHRGRRPPTTRLFKSTDTKLGDEVRTVPGPRRVSRPVIADTGGLLRALACRANGTPTFPWRMKPF